ncbi:uncharacterized protein LOC129744889 isoform X2 [Uranotaenia lowii]|uniref:uncharacterized protein LOC129744889 isoform X2 n=1 Tax=Uranotaenia lowii TaxID=190385 RepID=UPI0024785BB0|nr:uncharacterized protein LOC129744889 isoform X2 [Uranotaenia lowii]
MLGPTKWRLLTIVAGILLAHAIESPNSGKSNKLKGSVRTFSNSDLGLRIESLEPWGTRTITSRNLLVPHQTFSNVDNIRYIDSRSANSRLLRNTFGAFRFAEPQPYPGPLQPQNIPQRQAKSIPNRRSDDDAHHLGLRIVAQPEQSTSASIPEELPTPATLFAEEHFYELKNVTQGQQFRYKIIPINYFYQEPKPNYPLTPIHNNLPPKTTQNDEPQDVVFPSESSDYNSSLESNDTQTSESGTPSARRSGIQFPPGPYKPASTFTPQAYSEESFAFTDSLGVHQRPFNTAEEAESSEPYDTRQQRTSPTADPEHGEISRNMYANRFFRSFPQQQPQASPLDLRPAESLLRPNRVEFPGLVNIKQPTRDEVTKFGDVNGPVTAVQRPYIDYGDGKRYRAYDPNYFVDSPYQPNRSPYFPAKLFAESSQKIYQPWKTRTPRVVFPQGDFSSPSGFGIDNVVFRDQNFGLNELAAIQDVRNEFAQDDISDEISSTSKDRAAQSVYRPFQTPQKPKYPKSLPKAPHPPQKLVQQHQLQQQQSLQLLPSHKKPLGAETALAIRQPNRLVEGGPGGPGVFQGPMSGVKPSTTSLRSKPISHNRTRTPVGGDGAGVAGGGGAGGHPIRPEHPPVGAQIIRGGVRSEMQCQHEGGTCEFFLLCWMSGGLLHGSCGGLLKGCCHRTAKSANIGIDTGNTIDLTNLPNNEYGPIQNDPSCGISLAKQTAQRRIVGGDDAGFGSFPWQAYIRIGSSRCGGSLVSRRHVVTAGHCVARATPRQVHVTLGDYVINSAVEPLPAYTFGVRSINVHPYFKFTPQADRFDVAVLTLERTVHFMPHIAPICLPEKNEDFLGKFGWAAGWGALNPGSRLRPKTLQAVDVPVLDNRVCERWHRSNGINVVIYPEMLCAGYRGGGKDSCQGDSGGPLMHEKTGRWFLIGIVSAGYSCATRGQPGIYHRVAHTVDWISHIVQANP